MGRYKSAAVSTRAVKSARQSSSKPPRDEEIDGSRPTTGRSRQPPTIEGLHLYTSTTQRTTPKIDTIRLKPEHPGPTLHNMLPHQKPDAHWTYAPAADPRPPCPCKNKIYVEAPLCRTPEVRRVGCPSLEGPSALFALVAPQDGRGDDSELAGGVVRSEGKWRASSSFPLMPPSLSPR